MAHEPTLNHSGYILKSRGVLKRVKKSIFYAEQKQRAKNYALEAARMLARTLALECFSPVAFVLVSK
jgi:hypothetical protein